MNFRPAASEPVRGPGRTIGALLGLALLLLVAAWANQRLQPAPPAAPQAPLPPTAAPRKAPGPQAKGAEPREDQSGAKDEADQPRDDKAAGAAKVDWLRPISGDRFVTPAGLIYGPSRGEHRLDHVLRHTRDDPERAGSHGVFDAQTQDAVVALIDEAFRLAQSDPARATQERDGDRIVYTIAFERRIGYQGGQSGARNHHPACRRLTLVLEGNNVITAYPQR